MNQLSILPMAFVMIAGPQILSAIFLATSQHWQRSTAAYLAGAALSITLVVSLAYLLSPGAPRAGGSNQIVNVIVLVLLLAAMVHVFLPGNSRSRPSGWAGSRRPAHDSPSAWASCSWGVPTDILTSVAVGAFLSSHGDPWWAFPPFQASVGHGHWRSTTVGRRSR